MALSAATIAMIAAGVTAAGAVSQAQDVKQQTKFQSRVQEQQADQERLIASLAEGDFRKRQSALFAEARAGFGKSGVEMGSGSPLLASEDFAAETELQAGRIRAGGEMQATRLEQQAELTRRAGRTAQRQGYYRAGSSLLSGYAQSQR